MRKQSLRIWLVCAAAGLDSSSNSASISFHMLSIRGRWCEKLPKSIRKVDTLEEVSFKSVCLDGSCQWERTLQVEAEAVQSQRGGKWRGVCRDFRIVQGC